MIDLTNTWCEATEENYNALVKLGIYEGDRWPWERIRTSGQFKKDDIFAIKYENFEDCFNWVTSEHCITKYGKQIKLVDETFHHVKEELRDYQMDKIKESMEIKEECQFAKYGFEKPDFECEIFKEDYINNKKCYGVINIDDDWYDCSWSESGKLNCIANNTTLTKDLILRKFNLKPLKKEWYEDKSSRFKMFVLNDDSFKILHWWYKDKKELDCVDVKTGNKQTISVENTRLATKKEVLSLYKESK